MLVSVLTINHTSTTIFFVKFNYNFYSLHGYVVHFYDHFVLETSEHGAKYLSLLRCYHLHHKITMGKRVKQIAVVVQVVVWKISMQQNEEEESAVVVTSTGSRRKSSFRGRRTAKDCCCSR